MWATLFFGRRVEIIWRNARFTSSFILNIYAGRPRRSYVAIWPNLPPFSFLSVYYDTGERKPRELSLAQVDRHVWRIVMAGIIHSFVCGRAPATTDCVACDPQRSLSQSISKCPRHTIRRVFLLFCCPVSWAKCCSSTRVP